MFGKLYEKIKKNIWNILIWGTVVFFTILYFSLIFNINATTDEIFSLNMFKMSIRDMLDLTISDVHPPLYYLYGMIFELFSPQNILLQKISTIIPMTGSMVLVATILRKRIGNVATFFTLLFFCCLPCTMEYSVTLRMYSLCVFFVTLCGISCYLAYTENKLIHWIFVGVGFLGAAYTVYFAFIAVCFEAGFLFIAIISNIKKNKDRIKPWIITAVISCGLYAPWIPIIIKQFKGVSADYILPPISMSEIWGYFVWSFDLETIPGYVYLYLIVLVMVGVAGVVRLITKRASDRTRIWASLYAMLVPTCTALTGIVFSLIDHNIYEGRYFIIESMMLAMFFGINMAELIEMVSKKVIQKILVVAIMVFLLFSGAVQYYECYKMEYVGHYTEETIAFFEEHLGPNDYVLYNHPTLGYCYKYYFPNDRLFYVRDFDFENTDYENIWFLSNLYEWPITDADCYNYWLLKEYIGVLGIQDTNFDVFRYYHNPAPKHP